MVREESKLVAFPDENPMLGQYLRVAIDAGRAMTAKILKANGQVVYCSTYQGLTEKEVTSMVHIAQRDEFDARIAYKWGAYCTPEDFPDVALEDTPHYN
jgi:hypothetical protein